MALNRNGFTLIELLVVVAIIGVLASIAVPAFKEHKQRAYNTVAIRQLADATTGFSAYLADSGGQDALELRIQTDGSFTADVIYGSRITGASMETYFPGFVHTKGVAIYLSVYDPIAPATIYATHCRGSILNDHTAVFYRSFENKSYGGPVALGLSVDPGDCS